MKLRVLENERFTCHSCTNCCRNWHVELLDPELERVRSLAWPTDDPLHGADVTIKHAGKTFIAHRRDGSCVFLNEPTGRCRIHEQFGIDAKPLGCRLYPFQVRATFDGEATVTGRYDCPSIRRNEGAPHSDALPELRQLIQRIHLSESLDESACANLSRQQVVAVCEFVATMIGGFDRDEQRAIFIFSLANLLAMTSPDEITRENLGAILPGLRRLVQDSATPPMKRPGVSIRMAFRSLLGQYLRRDEEVLDHRASRMARAIAMTKLVMGFGSFKGLGLSHAAGSIRRAGLFEASPLPVDAGAFDLFWRMIRNKLDSFQFFGPSNRGRNLFEGLRSLALLYPLTLAVARYIAANRGSTRIQGTDVDSAVATIEHSFGRQASLHQSHGRSLEKTLLSPETFLQLVRTI